MRLKVTKKGTDQQIWHKSLAVRQKAKILKYISLVLLISNIVSLYYLYKK